jgi:low affinity Fe/Cu permease
MNSIFSTAIAAVSATSVLFLPVSAQQQINRDDDAIVQRLDEILRRLEAIEERLKKLKGEDGNSNERWVDENGVMRTIDGYPVGFWGIDCPPKNRTR